MPVFLGKNTVIKKQNNKKIEHWCEHIDIQPSVLSWGSCSKPVLLGAEDPILQMCLFIFCFKIAN